MATDWLTSDEVRDLWPDAPDNDVALDLIVETARIQCREYAEPLKDGADVPPTHRQAQLAQARAIWNLTQTSPQDETIGFGDQSVRVYPMSSAIKRMLRPPRGKPGIF